MVRALLFVVGLQAGLMGLTACGARSTDKIHLKDASVIKAENDVRRRDMIDTFMATDRIFNVLRPEDSSACESAELILTTGNKYLIELQCTGGSRQSYSGAFERIYDSDVIFAHFELDTGYMTILRPEDSDAECVKIYFDSGPLRGARFLLCDR